MLHDGLWVHDSHPGHDSVQIAISRELRMKSEGKSDKFVDNLLRFNRRLHRCQAHQFYNSTRMPP